MVEVNRLTIIAGHAGQCAACDSPFVVAIIAWTVRLVRAGKRAFRPLPRPKPNRHRQYGHTHQGKHDLVCCHTSHYTLSGVRSKFNADLRHTVRVMPTSQGFRAAPVAHNPACDIYCSRMSLIPSCMSFLNPGSSILLGSNRSSMSAEKDCSRIRPTIMKTIATAKTLPMIIKKNSMMRHYHVVS